MHPVLLDREEIQTQRQEKIARFLKYFGVIMAVFYLAAGTALFVMPLFGGVPQSTRYVFGTLLLLYGVFRAWRIFRQN